MNVCMIIFLKLTWPYLPTYNSGIQTNRGCEFVDINTNDGRKKDIKLNLLNLALRADIFTKKCFLFQ